MDITSGTSFYDTINKLLIGFLLLLPWLGKYTPSGSYEFLLLAVGSYVVGIFFWGLVDGLICPFLNKIFRRIIRLACLRNKLNKIIRCCGCKYNIFNRRGRYYKAYYTVQEHGLLGAVNIMESFSAFFLNFIFVSIYWAAIIRWGSLPLFFGPICIDCESCSCSCSCLCLCSCSCSCGKGSLLQISPCCAIWGLFGLAILSLIFRCIVEIKIQCTVLDAYKYILNENKSN